MFLWSLNERAAGREGLDIKRPSFDWWSELVQFEQWQQARDKAKEPGKIPGETQA